MRYLLIIFEGEQYWIEISDEGYALRQINIDANRNVQVSCIEDCLAEGYIDEDELEGTIRIISQLEFEIKWEEATLEIRKRWNNEKDNYKIGKKVKCKAKYLYPQGWILKIDQLQGICNSEFEMSYNQQIEGKVSGYDEVNMWLLINEIKRID